MRGRLISWAGLVVLVAAALFIFERRPEGLFGVLTAWAAEVRSAPLPDVAMPDDASAQLALADALCSEGRVVDGQRIVAHAVIAGDVDAIAYQLLMFAPRRDHIANPTLALALLQKWSRISKADDSAPRLFATRACVAEADRFWAEQFASSRSDFPSFAGALAGAYEIGEGLPQHLPEAYALQLALERALRDASFPATPNPALARLEAQLTPAEIAAARYRADEWYALNIR